jgi:hypothetical protein
MLRFRLPLRHRLWPGWRPRAGRALVLAAAALAAVPACSGSEPAIARETFIDAMVELRRADRETDEPDAFEARRAEILVARGVTDEDLLGFVRAHEGDLALLAAVFDSINARLNRVHDETPNGR